MWVAQRGRPPKSKTVTGTATVQRTGRPVSFPKLDFFVEMIFVELEYISITDVQRHVTSLLDEYHSAKLCPLL